MTEQIPLALPVLADLGADAFLIASSNRQAVAWIDRWPDWPGRRLVLVGPEGSGKTHLAQIWAARAGACTLHATMLGAGERNDQDPVALATLCEAWLVEDLHRLQDEQALLHLFNALAQRQGHLLLTSQIPLGHLQVLLPDLRSRLATITQAEIQSPQEELLGGVLRKLFADRQLQVPERVIRYLLPRMGRSLQAAARIVAALDAGALAQGGGISLALARQVLQSERGEDDIA